MLEKNITKAVNDSRRLKALGGSFFANPHRPHVVLLRFGQVATHRENVTEVVQALRFGKAFRGKLVRKRKRSSVVLLCFQQVSALVSYAAEAAKGSRKTKILGADLDGTLPTPADNTFLREPKFRLRLVNVSAHACKSSARILGPAAAPRSIAR